MRAARNPRRRCVGAAKAAPRTGAVAAFALAIALAAACQQGTTIRKVDRGAVCANPAGAVTNAGASGPRVLAADQPISITVVNEGCLSSSCDFDRLSHCSASRSGNVITVRSEHTWRRTDGPCTPDCALLAAACNTETLPAGPYTLEFGGQTASIVVGGADNGPCPDLRR